MSPGIIDGQAARSSTPSQPTSTNFFIGEPGFTSQPGTDIRTEYRAQEGWGASGSGVGWTYAVDDGNGRDLGMHRYGDGWEQTFQQHPDSNGNDLSGIYAPDSATGYAFWVPPDYWTVLEESGGTAGPLGYPTAEKGSCPSGAPGGCTAYQQFEGGFIYTGSGGIVVVSAGLYSVSDDAIYTDHYRSLVPGGASWAIQDGTPPDHPRNLKYFGDGLLFHGVDTTGGQFRRSTDCGETWSDLTTPSTTLKPIDVDRDANGKLWSLWQTSSVGKIYYSTDDGDNWTLSKELLSSFAGFGSIAVDRANRDRLAVAWAINTASLRVTVSTDGGDNWTTYSPGYNGNGQPQVIWSGGNLVLVVDNGTTFRILRSTDDGANWTQVKTVTTSSISSTKNQIIGSGDDGPLFAMAQSSDSSPSIPSSYRRTTAPTGRKLVRFLPAR